MIITTFIKAFFEQTQTRYFSFLSQRDFRRTSKVLMSEKKNKGSEIALLDAGCGLADFALYINEKHPEIHLQCVDISPDLVQKAKSEGLNCSEASLRSLPFANDSFDVVHCAHVIEHLPYPLVADALDEMLRVVKKEGVLILKSPLRMRWAFFSDLDHIRVYPPTAILNYYKRDQQQRKGKIQIQEVTRWNENVAYNLNADANFPKLARLCNRIFQILFLAFRFPVSFAVSYTLVLRKK